MKFPPLLSLHFIVVLIIFVAEVASQTKPGCSGRCGSLEIPYPFGISEGCSLDDSFLITCNTTFSPPRPFLGPGNTPAPVLNISLDGELRVSFSVACQCYDASGMLVEETTSSLVSEKFPISTRNRFTAVGCDTFAAIAGTRGQNFTTGCLSLCDQMESVTNGSCAGIGCCQTMIPIETRNFGAAVGGLNNHSTVNSFNPSSFAFLVEEGFYNFSIADLIDMQNKQDMPVVLDWTVGNITCQEAQKDLTTYACEAANSECLDSNNGPGYRCRCKTGFQGNAYLVDGCQDIDECKASNPCSGKCNNFPGGVSMSLLLIIIAGCWIYWGVQKRKLIKLKEKFFQQNGGLMLQQKLSNGSIETAKIYTAEELKEATNNYHESRVLGQGGYGTVYKGILPDNKVVAIKKSKVCDQSQIEQFINEVLVLSQINHRNVVKLLGCFLETEVPLLVYEFITNGTLADHLHDKLSASSLPWEMRLKVAAETAGALAYLHSATSMPIIHRDVKTSNILLDNSYTTKVSDFGASRLVPLDQTQLTTLVQGTLGYLDPEYFHSSQLTEKSDVYSFGVVLAELLTGKQALAFDRPEKERNLAIYFISSMKEDRLVEILDDGIMNEGSIQKMNQTAEVAKRCLRVRGEERPSMKEVAMELEGLRAVEKHSWIKVDLGIEETEHLLPIPSSYIEFGSNSGNVTATTTTSGFDSLRDQIFSTPLHGGR
ncbi:hypothetical protein GOBAR_AA04389 [Gossypium barbadense]|uniref:Protein kinase domain-containing protein n=1 Tax=Gossypium barbadense TaxID=3634 RepID=A0A2P5YKR6_GOSBA|nr:hypothetical protein GOBAR_AA04389 [Gossypium barbadense]